MNDDILYETDSDAVYPRRLGVKVDEFGVLTHKVCCICFEWVLVDNFYVDRWGQKWDMCKEDGRKNQ